MFAPGDKLGRYMLGAPLGEGGMGQVFRATDEQLHREVALKVMITEKGVAPSDEARARMMREARAAAALSHPNVVAIYDVGEASGLPYLVMELVPGKSLRALSHDPTLSKTQWVRWLSDVAMALGAAHRAGLVHRDVKPDNVMVSNTGAVKVLDFGIARTASTPVEPSAPTAAKALETLTKQGLLVGTAQYMAPEQIRGLPLDGRCDQFAWGVMAYELLSGDIPFRGADTMAQLASILMDEPPSLDGKITDVSPHVAAAVQRALRKAREQRFATMEALVEALNDPTSGVSPSVRPSSSSLPQGSSVRPPGSSVRPPSSSAHPPSGVPEARPVSAAIGAPPRSGPSDPLGPPSAEQRAFVEAKTAAMAVSEVPSVTSGSVTLSPLDAEKKARRRAILRTALIALAVLAVGRSVLHSMRFSWSSSGHPVTSVSAEGSAAPSSSSALQRVLPCEELDAPMPNACASTAVAWCDPERKLVGCCGPDMVPEGRDGVCGCAPGGSTSGGNKACPSGGSKEDYSPKFQAAVREHFPELRACYEQGLRESDALVGRIAVGVKLGPTGDVVDAKFKDSGLPSAAAQRCVLSTFRSMRFPPPPGGSLGAVYPISFSPGPPPSDSATSGESSAKPSASR